MSSFFGFVRNSTRSTAAAKSTAVGSTATAAGIATLGTMGRSASVLNENFGPASKAAAVEKPGQAQPVRRTLGDITNSGMSLRPRNGKPTTAAAKPTGIPSIIPRATSTFALGSAVATSSATVSVTAATSKRPDMVLQSIRQSTQILQNSRTTTDLGVFAGATSTVATTASAAPVVVTVAAPALIQPEPMNLDIDAVEDIDEGDFDDPQFCADYVAEIYDYLKRKELADRINPSYLTTVQRKINGNMRSLIVNWMVAMMLKFHLLTDTVFLAVSLLDKYLERVPIDREQLQLVGVTAMLIAVKTEEIVAIQVKDFIYVTDNVFTAKQITAFEPVLLKAVGWNIFSPSSLQFLRRFSKAAKNDGRHHTLAKYIIEIALVDSGCIRYLPSQQAAGACYLARRMLGTQPYWTPTLAHYSGYSEDDVIPVARDLNKQVKSLHLKYNSVYRKYSSPKLAEVAKIPAVPEPF